MSTRCLIGILNSDDTITHIYCHHDGYPELVGAVLKQHYTEPEKLKALMALGDISTLGIDPVDFGWNGGLPEKTGNYYSQCIAYKSRGENTPARNSINKVQYCNDASSCFAEYAYLGEQVGDKIIWKVRPIYRCGEVKFEEF